MKRLVLLVLVAAVLAGTPSARGQFRPPAPPNYGPGYRPQLSPYLNLIRGGDPAANYYLGTLPEFQRRANDQTFRTDIAELDRRTLGQVATEEERLREPLPDSGHPTAFGTTLYYFGGQYGTAGLGQRPGTGVPPRQPFRP